LGDPFIPIATAVIILYMMYRRVPFDLLLLLGAFILNINPLYVTILFICWKLSMTKPKPKLYCTPKILPIPKTLLRIDQISNDKPFDFVLMGNNISTMYTAALLSKVGQKCCVLLPENAPATEIKIPDAPTSIILESLSIGHFNISSFYILQYTLIY
jgi:hypothetical protein